MSEVIIFDGEEVSTEELKDMDWPLLIEITEEGVVLTKLNDN